VERHGGNAVRHIRERAPQLVILDVGP